MSRSLIDPDPLSAFLAILGAAGSVASLVASYQPAYERKRKLRADTVAAIRDATIEAELAFSDLAAQARALQIITIGFGITTREQVFNRTPVAFGRMALVLPSEGHAQWERAYDHALAASGRLSHSLNDILRLFAGSELRLDPDTASYLSLAIDGLNELVLDLQKLDPHEMFTQLERAVGQCAVAMRELRRHIQELPR